MGYATFTYDADVSHIEIEVEKYGYRGKLTLSLTVPAAEAMTAFAMELRGSTLPVTRLSIDDFGMLDISVSPKDTTGHYMISIELSCGGNAAKVGLVVDYAQVLEFSNQLRALVEGRLEHFTVQEF